MTKDDSQVVCRNNSGVKLERGMPVMVTGAIGAHGRLTIAPMDASDAANIPSFFGVAAHDIVDGADGSVTAFGDVRSIDTSAWDDGDLLWCDPSTAGGLTATMPGSGAVLQVGYVARAHAEAGVLQVRSVPTPGPTPGNTVTTSVNPLTGVIEMSGGLAFSARKTTEVLPIEFEQVPYTVIVGAPGSTTGGVSDWPNAIMNTSQGVNRAISWTYVGKSSKVKIVGATIVSPLVFRDTAWRLVAAIVPDATGIVDVPIGASWVSKTYVYSGGAESAALKIYLPRRIVLKDQDSADSYAATMAAKRKAVLISPNSFFGPSTQYARILAALDFIRKSGGGTLHLSTDTKLSSNVWTISRPLILPSNTAIFIDNATLRLADGVFDNIIRSESITFDPNAPYGVIKHLGLTENIEIYGSGKDTAFIEGPNTPYSAAHPISGGAPVPWVGDKYGWRTIGILLANVKNYSVHDFTLRKTTAWGISSEHGCDNFVFDEIKIDSTVDNGDGINIRKGCSNGVIKNISGTQSDDTVAMTAIQGFIPSYPSLPYIYPMQVLGDSSQPAYGNDIKNITVSGVNSASGANQVRVLATGGSKIEKVSINDVTSAGALVGQQVVIQTGSYGAPADLGDISNITVNNIACNHAGVPVHVNAPVRNVHVNGIQKRTALGGVMHSTGAYAATADNLTFSNERFI